MIVRIMGEGQWVLEPTQLLELNDLDNAVEDAVANDDAAALAKALEELSAAIRATASQVPDDVIVESDLVLPDADATVEEVRALLDAQSDYYGLLPDEANLPDTAGAEGETAS